MLRFTPARPVSTIASQVITLIGACIPLFLAEPKNVIKGDGTPVIIHAQSTFVAEFRGLYHTLRHDPLVILLFPAFFASNFFYTFQFNEFNGSWAPFCSLLALQGLRLASTPPPATGSGLFTARARTLNNRSSPSVV